MHSTLPEHLKPPLKGKRLTCGRRGMKQLAPLMSSSSRIYVKAFASLAGYSKASFPLKAPLFLFD